MSADTALCCIINSLFFGCVVLLFLDFVAARNFPAYTARRGAFCLNPEDAPIIGDGLSQHASVKSLYLSEAHIQWITREIMLFIEKPKGRSIMISNDGLLPICKELVVYAYWQLFQICPKSVRWLLLSRYSLTFCFVMFPNKTGMTGPNLFFCVSISWIHPPWLWFQYMCLRLFFWWFCEIYADRGTLPHFERSCQTSPMG